MNEQHSARPTDPGTYQVERIPTHRCKICGCFWILWQFKKAADADCVCADGLQRCKYCAPHRALLDRIDEALRAAPETNEVQQLRAYVLELIPWLPPSHSARKMELYNIVKGAALKANACPKSDDGLHRPNLFSSPLSCSECNALLRAAR